jgi:hypothetical protein
LEAVVVQRDVLWTSQAARKDANDPVGDVGGVMMVPIDAIGGTADLAVIEPNRSILTQTGIGGQRSAAMHKAMAMC